MSANLGLTWDQLMRLGGNPFNMTVGALRLSRKSNAVAQLHGVTANRMWKNIQGASEIVAITNGIHRGTWVDPAMLKSGETGEKLWENHMVNKRNLVKMIEERNGAKLDPNKLLIGFSRRTVPYKRTELVFSKPEVINPLLEEQKVQFVFSGKAHPNDDASRQIVARLVKLSKQFPNSVVFLENYDMTIGAAMTRGVDVWLNNPRRPKEASGTSGMKAAMNGVLNLSILDGWWPEACHHGFNGWQFGNAYEATGDNYKKQDDNDRNALYNILLNEVIPTFYDKHDQWVAMMRNSIQDTRDGFSVKRMLDEYYAHLYKM
jgi:starch phosphorylase